MGGKTQDVSWDKFSSDITGLQQTSLEHAWPQEPKMFWCWCAVSALPRARRLRVGRDLCPFCPTALSACVGCANMSKSHRKEICCLRRLTLWTLLIDAFTYVCNRTTPPTHSPSIATSELSAVAKFLHAPQPATHFTVQPPRHQIYMERGIWSWPLQVTHCQLKVCVCG